MVEPGDLSQLINLFDVEEAALEVLSPAARDYYRSGAHDQITLGENRRAFDRLALYYRVLVDVSACSTATTVLGQPVAHPILVAPTAFHGLAHHDAELASVRAAGGAGTIFVNSTLSNTALEDVVAAASGPVWFQLYVYRDRQATRALVERAAAAGAGALVLTVDAPRLGRRESDVRNRFALPPHLEVKNLAGAGRSRLDAPAADSGLAEYFERQLDPALTWGDLDWLAGITSLPLLVKGIVRPDDAVRAVEHGAAGVVVSNHGGRQLDTAPAAIEALPAVAAAVDGHAEVLVDGGVRRGTDVVKAIARGARAVLIGRPVLWGLAVAGEAGVAHVLSLLAEELGLAMTLSGCPSIRDITGDLLG